MTDLTFALSECLDALERGELTLEGCLVRYPEHQRELESLLGTMARLRAAPPLAPSKFFQRTARVRLARRLSPRTAGPTQPTQPEQPTVKPNLSPRTWPVWLGLASMPILIVGLALLLGVGWFAFYRPAPTADLNFTLISLDTAAPFDGVYCYTALNQQPFDRFPNSLDLVPPDSAQPQHYTFGQTFNLPQPTAQPLTLRAECWGRLGVEALPLGSIQATHPAADWDGTIRTAIVDEVYSLRYCLSQTTSQCK